MPECHATNQAASAAREIVAKYQPKSVPVTIPRDFRPLTLTSTISISESRYWIDQYHLLDLHNRGITGHGAKICIVDTGIDRKHATDPNGLFLSALAGKAVASGVAKDAWDDNGHGTHCAGIVHQVAPGAKLLAAKALGGNGSGDSRSISKCIRWGVEQGATVISASLGSSAADSLLRDAANYCERNGVLLIAAAGNDGKSNNVDYPAAFSSVLAVGAIDSKKNLASFSDRGSEVDVVAPGVQIKSAWLNGGYFISSGTSMATPWIAGIAGLLHGWEIGKYGKVITNSREKLMRWLSSGCLDLGDSGRDKSYGVGVPVPGKLFAKMVDGGDGNGGGDGGGQNPNPNPTPKPPPSPQDPAAGDGGDDRSILSRLHFVSEHEGKPGIGLFLEA